MLPINRHPSPRELGRFARIWLPLFVAGAGAMLLWRTGSIAAAAGMWIVGGVLAVLAIASAEAARVVFVGLQVVTYPIGLVVSTLALALMFYGVFTPLGWLMRATRRDALRLRRRDERSHWVRYTQDDDPERAFRLF